MRQAVAFFEVVSAEPDQAQTFYGELFGWPVFAGPDGNPVALRA